MEARYFVVEGNYEEDITSRRIFLEDKNLFHGFGLFARRRGVVRLEK